MSILARLWRKSTNNPGVYRIKNTVNGMEYIGATTRTIAERWEQHKGNLVCGRYKNNRMQLDWDRYGPEAFTIEVVEIVRDERLVFERERYWQDISYSPRTSYNQPNTPAVKPSWKSSKSNPIINEQLSTMSNDEILYVMTMLRRNDGSYRFTEKRIAKFIGGRIEDRVAQVRAVREKHAPAPQAQGRAIPVSHRGRDGHVMLLDDTC